MAIDRRNYRLDMGQNFVMLRSAAVARNFAMVTASQINRGGLRAKTVTGDMIAEDVSKLGTADTIVAYSQTDYEKKLNMARIYVDGARGAPDRVPGVDIPKLRFGPVLYL